MNHPASRGPRLLQPGLVRLAAALAELAYITGGRTDLLAQYVGQRLAWHDTELDDTIELEQGTRT